MGTLDRIPSDSLRNNLQATFLIFEDLYIYERSSCTLSKVRGTKKDLYVSIRVGGVDLFVLVRHSFNQEIAVNEIYYL